MSFGFLVFFPQLFKGFTGSKQWLSFWFAGPGFMFAASPDSAINKINTNP